MTDALVWHPVTRPIKVHVTYLTRLSTDPRATRTYDYDVLAYAIRDRDLLYMTAQGYYLDVAWYRQQDDRYMKVVLP